ncbi:MAG: DNA gyrase inhibitor YacG [Planctomycetota bacterium]
MIQEIRCPICSKSLEAVCAEHPSFPFCSDRCRKIDLARWWDGRYAITENLTPEQMHLKLLEQQGINPDDIP